MMNRNFASFLLEISLLDSAYQRSTASREDGLIDAAKRYRVDTEKLQKIVAKKSPRNETRKQSSRGFASQQTESIHVVSLRRSAN